MNLTEQQGGWVIILSFVVALVLTAIPLPEIFAIARPEWVMLVVIFWSIAVPNRFGLISAWLAGLAQDLLMGNLMGLHALTFALISYITLRLYQRLRISTISRQCFTVFLLSLLNQFILLWIYRATGSSVGGLLFWLPSLTSVIFWPIVFITLRQLQQVFSVR